MWDHRNKFVCRESGRTLLPPRIKQEIPTEILICPDESVEYNLHHYIDRETMLDEKGDLQQVREMFLNKSMTTGRTKPTKLPEKPKHPKKVRKRIPLTARTSKKEAIMLPHVRTRFSSHTTTARNDPYGQTAAYYYPDVHFVTNLSALIDNDPVKQMRIQAHSRTAQTQARSATSRTKIVHPWKKTTTGSLFSKRFRAAPQLKLNAVSRTSTKRKEEKNIKNNNKIVKSLSPFKTAENEVKKLLGFEPVLKYSSAVISRLLEDALLFKSLFLYCGVKVHEIDVSSNIAPTSVLLYSQQQQQNASQIRDMSCVDRCKFVFLLIEILGRNSNEDHHDFVILMKQLERIVLANNSHNNTCIKEVSKSQAHEKILTHYEIVQRLRKDQDRIAKKKAELEEKVKIAKGELVEVEEHLSYARAWAAKKDTQLEIHRKADRVMTESLESLQEHHNTVSEELERMITTRVQRSHQLVNEAGGLTFGGSLAMEYRHMLRLRDYNVELQKAKTELTAMKRTNDTKRLRLQNVKTEQDLLLTRIEVLEQAVSMMHTQVSYKRTQESENRKQMRKKLESNATTPKSNGYSPSMLSSINTRKRIIGDVTSPGTRLTLIRKRSVAERNYGSMPPPPKNKPVIFGLGMYDDIPSFLQFDGWVYDRKMQKKDAELKIREIWSLKSLADQRASQWGGTICSLSSFFESYLDVHYPHIIKEGDNNEIEPIKDATPDTPGYERMEFTYNFYNALSKHFIDGDFLLFLNVLWNQVHESHYFDQMMMLSTFKTALAEWEIRIYDPETERMVRTGFISTDKFFTGLNEFLPVKSKERMDELIEIANRDLLNKRILPDSDTELAIDLVKLLSEDDEGNQSDFIECIRFQYLEEIHDFITELRASLYEKADTANKENGCNEFVTNARVTIADVEECLRKVDPLKSFEELEQYMIRGVRESSEDYEHLVPSTEIGIESFLKNLMSTGLHTRTGHWSRVA